MPENWQPCDLERAVSWALESLDVVYNRIVGLQKDLRDDIPIPDLPLSLEEIVCLLVAVRCILDIVKCQIIAATEEKKP